MEDPGSTADVLRRMRAIAPLSDEDAAQLSLLLTGVRSAALRMESLIPVFPAELDTTRLSQTVDGEDGS